MKLAYLIPMFPAQTHAFFWRERQCVLDMEHTVDLVTTREPPPAIVSHSWSEEARQLTEVLFPMSFAEYLSAAGKIILAGPATWGRIINTILTAQVPNLKERLQLVALSLVGAKFASLAQSKNWDHVHVHSCANTANIALFAHLITGLPYSMTLHGPLHDYGSNQPAKWRHAAFVIVITQKIFDEVTAELGDNIPQPLQIAPMGVEVEKFTRDADKPYVAYNKSDENPARLFACGRLNFCKGHQDLIHAVGLLKDRGYNVHLDIAGEDEQGGTGFHQDLEVMINKLGLQEEVTLLGAVSEQVVRDHLQAAHIFVLASLGEPLGVAYMEAMAMQTPTIGTDAGGVRELIDHETDGLLVKPENPNELADVITQILDDANLAQRLSDGGRDKIANQFSSKRSAEVIVNNIRRTLDAEHTS